MARQNQNPSNIQNYLSGVNYPAKKNDLIQTARRNNAPNDVIQQLESMPDQRFEQPTEVQEAISGRTRGSQGGGKTTQG